MFTILDSCLAGFFLFFYCVVFVLTFFVCFFTVFVVVLLFSCLFFTVFVFVMTVLFLCARFDCFVPDNVYTYDTLLLLSLVRMFNHSVGDNSYDDTSRVTCLGDDKDGGTDTDLSFGYGVGCCS